MGRGNAAPSPEDLERLEYATGGRSIDPTAGLFTADSITRRVTREGALLLGGGRALLLQVAHPLVAAGVAAHSNFRRDPMQRLWRTLELTLTIVFADAASAVRAVRTIERVHAQVRGRLDADVGPFPQGTPYDANDPQLLFWVHATLLDTALRVYERFIEPLSPSARATYYEESKITARLFGVPAALTPATLGDFRRYMRDMIRSDTLTVDATSKAIADAVLRPRSPLGLKEAMAPARFLTIGLLPPRLRRQYGYSWNRAQDAAAGLLARSSRVLLPWVPHLIRDFPHARRG